jgi:hypothetical protein
LLFEALISSLEQGAASVDDLITRPGLVGFGKQALRDGLMRLVIAGQLTPFLRSTRTQSEAGNAMQGVPVEYNRMILQRRLSPDLPIALCSPVAGTGISITMLQAVAIRLLTEVEPAQRPAWIRALFEAQPFTLKVGDQAENDKVPAVLELLMETERFRVQWVPKLIELGVLGLK